MAQVQFWMVISFRNTFFPLNCIPRHELFPYPKYFAVQCVRAMKMFEIIDCIAIILFICPMFNVRFNGLTEWKWNGPRNIWAKWKFHISRYFYWFIILPYCRSSQRLNMRKSQFSFVCSIVRLVLFAQDAADLWLLNHFGIVSFGNLVFVLRVHFLWVCLSILLVAQLLLNECIHQDDLMYATS